MANNYATVPAVIPGDLRVQGKLTVAGGQFILGQLQRKYRIQELANGQFIHTVNWDYVNTGFDDATCAKIGYELRADITQHYFLQQPAGAGQTDTNQFNFTPANAYLSSGALRLGATTPYIRLFNNPPNATYLSSNLASDGTTRDDPTHSAFYQLYDTSTQQLTASVTNVAGTQVLAAYRRTFWLDRTTHNVTGTTSPTTIASKTLAANQLGPFGGILFRMVGGMASVAGGGFYLYVNWGGVARAILSLPASTSTGWWVEASITNQGATNNQIIAATGAYATSAQSQAMVSTAVDTTVNQPLAVVITPLNVADVINVYSIEADFIYQASAL